MDRKRSGEAPTTPSAKGAMVRAGLEIPCQARVCNCSALDTLSPGGTLVATHIMTAGDAHVEVKIDFDGFLAAKELAEIVEQVERGFGSLGAEYLWASGERSLPFFPLAISALKPGSLTLVGQVGNTSNIYSETIYGYRPSPPSVREKIVSFVRDFLPERIGSVQGVVYSHHLRGARERGSRVRSVSVELKSAGQEDNAPASASADPAAALPPSAPTIDDTPLEISVDFDGMIGAKELSDIFQALDTELLRELCADHREYSRLLEVSWLRSFFCLQAGQGKPFVFSGFIGRTGAAYGLPLYLRPMGGEAAAWQNALADLSRKLQTQPAVLETISRNLAGLVANGRHNGSRLTSASVRLKRERPADIVKKPGEKRPWRGF